MIHYSHYTHLWAHMSADWQPKEKKYMHTKLHCNQTEPMDAVCSKNFLSQTNNIPYILSANFIFRGIIIQTFKPLNCHQQKSKVAIFFIFLNHTWTSLSIYSIHLFKQECSKEHQVTCCRWSTQNMKWTDRWLRNLFVSACLRSQCNIHVRGKHVPEKGSITCSHHQLFWTFLVL